METTNNLPTEPGWYFVKSARGNYKHMHCVEVTNDDINGLIVWLTGTQWPKGLDQFKWFGKVSMPVEVD